MPRQTIDGVPDEPEVRAAGGLLWRTGGDGQVEVLLVHRPRYDDWTMPKGKCDPGESWEDTAHREVLEETGFDVELGAELPYATTVEIESFVVDGAMVMRSGTFVPNDEVDDIAWLSQAEARTRLTYDHDTVVLDSFTLPGA